MAIKEGLRPGGRSARVQESIHSAVRELLEEQERSTLTVPQIATRAGVTPSTIYRRWGDLSALLADVALERMRPDSEPAATGSLRGDLRAWSEQYLDEMSSEPGRNMMRDVQCSSTPGYCVSILSGQLQIILDRHRHSETALPSIDRLLNMLVAPTVFRILFAAQPLEVQELHELIDIALRP
ncbi:MULTISPECIES: TetR/AcrR family transcriptional regulator [Pseudomonas]|jgi:AcrR family transcriptional regulator|uniref:TetR/AcrR family transcriptional regulator n=1 Tax=Pseudomonas TaxID=286 RepID=UPI0008CDB812|nr:MULTISPECIES: TetR/AcrR family transcriptional regulator [Pseudomonas]MCP1483456.1 AcrR family transcriptional regulator [Pseudomonas chlororaphis]MCP1596188.1 AcrR family transcriptional regulator [Pseudomonas chlororaphis]WPO45932.1 TetR/AcrR family transcriptional regulator [Pseudomonas sp. S1Bt23]SEL42040.1 transcriptional regulator, TetR family [Pseudomonas sp. NFACC41-3]SMH50515.1 transcriptional regulator, TetR family [Pseudomonas sp. NFIX51]